MLLTWSSWTQCFARAVHQALPAVSCLTKRLSEASATRVGQDARCERDLVAPLDMRSIADASNVSEGARLRPYASIGVHRWLRCVISAEQRRKTFVRGQCSLLKNGTPQVLPGLTQSEPAWW